jgi:progranulin
MLLSFRLWTLPPSLLALLVSFPTPIPSRELQDGRTLPRNVKYFPEHEAVARRELDIQQRLQREPVIGMRKMSGDPGEKFYLDYWLFAESDGGWTNESLIVPFTNSFLVHTDSNTSMAPRYLDWRRISLFQKRGYRCPSGTDPCNLIKRPNSCCATGSTCQLINDTGLGDVGCCPAEETCGGSVSDCGEGYTSCPKGGGCCVPGYACDDVGCVQTAVVSQVVPPQASTTTVTLLVTVTASGGGLRTLITTVVVPPPPPTPSSSYIPPPPSTRTTTSTTRSTSTRSTAYPCPTDYRSCPSSLGGGCCHTDRACGPGQQCPAYSTSGSYAPPARPTDDVTTTTFSSISGVGCPTGFYACSAYYEGGCCQIDRDCGKTSCPTLASTTLVSNPPTIVAPTGSGITAPGSLLTGPCYQGWFTCAPADGGGCCQNGYTCGVYQCTASRPGGGQDSVGKQAPSNAALSRGMENVLILLALAVSSAALGFGILL